MLHVCTEMCAANECPEAQDTEDAYYGIIVTHMQPGSKNAAK